MTLESLTKKYNRRSPNDTTVSPMKIVEQLLQYGNLEEIKYIYNNYPKEVQNNLSKIEKNIYFPAKRKKILQFISEVKYGKTD
jgi:predicted ATPase